MLADVGSWFLVEALFGFRNLISLVGSSSEMAGEGKFSTCENKLCGDGPTWVQSLM